jgi:hypothetical protein
MMFFVRHMEVTGMDLKDFVKQTLLDVFEAVREAGEEVSEKRRGAVAPLWGGIEHVSNHEQAIKFDVAVTAGDTKSAGGGGKIKVLGIFELDGKGGVQSQTREVSRVSFSIPVAFPGTVVEGSAPQPRRKTRK